MTSIFAIACAIFVLSVAAVGAEEEEEKAVHPHIAGSRMWLAAWQGDIPALKAAIERDGADVDWRNTDDGEGGSTALMVASKRGNAEAVQVLLKNKADANIADTTGGMTALMHAAAKGKHETIELLLAVEGIDADAKATGGKYDGKTALEIAQAGAHLEAAKVLRKAAPGILGSIASWFSTSKGDEL